MKKYNFGKTRQEVKDSLYGNNTEHIKEGEIENTEPLEEEKSDEEKAKDAIKGIIEKDWGGNNKDQYGAVQLLSGLSSNNSDIANKFMDDLDKLTNKMDLSKYGM